MQLAVKSKQTLPFFEKKKGIMTKEVGKNGFARTMAFNPILTCVFLASRANWLLLAKTPRQNVFPVRPFRRTQLLLLEKGVSDALGNFSFGSLRDSFFGPIFHSSRSQHNGAVLPSSDDADGDLCQYQEWATSSSWISGHCGGSDSRHSLF